MTNDINTVIDSLTTARDAARNVWELCCHENDRHIRQFGHPHPKALRAELEAQDSFVRSQERLMRAERARMLSLKTKYAVLSARTLAAL